MVRRLLFQIINAVFLTSRCIFTPLNFLTVLEILCPLSCLLWGTLRDSVLKRLLEGQVMGKAIPELNSSGGLSSSVVQIIIKIWGNGNPFQYSCLKNPMESYSLWGWKSCTQLSNWTHIHMSLPFLTPLPSSTISQPSRLSQFLKNTSCPLRFVCVLASFFFFFLSFIGV